MQCLVIGGSNNGEWIEVPEDQKFVILPDRRSTKKFSTYTGATMEAMTVKTEEYRIANFRVGSRVFWLAIEKSLGAEEGIDLLLAGYMGGKVVPV